VKALRNCPAEKIDTKSSPATKPWAKLLRSRSAAAVVAKRQPKLRYREYHLSGVSRQAPISPTLKSGHPVFGGDTK
jgi:hypothetical protein